MLGTLIIGGVVVLTAGPALAAFVYGARRSNRVAAHGVEAIARITAILDVPRPPGSLIRGDSGLVRVDVEFPAPDGSTTQARVTTLESFLGSGVQPGWQVAVRYLPRPGKQPYILIDGAAREPG